MKEADVKMDPHETKQARAKLFREAVIFQLKLMADGLRDLVLMPIALVATLAGLIRGGDKPEKEFNQVLEMGRQSEQWINLFGQHMPIDKAGQAGSMDLLLTRAEEVVREQARSGGISESASRAVQRALAAVHDEARQEEKPVKPDVEGKAKTERGFDI